MGDGPHGAERIAVKLAQKLAEIQVDRAKRYGVIKTTCTRMSKFQRLLRGAAVLPDADERALGLVSLKLARLAEEVRQRSISEDTCLDLANYVLLFYEVVKGDENGCEPASQTTNKA